MWCGVTSSDSAFEKCRRMNVSASRTSRRTMRVQPFASRSRGPAQPAGSRRAAQMFAHLAGFDLDRAALLGEHHGARAQTASAAAARAASGAAAGGGRDHRALRQRNAPLQRLLLRREIRLRGLRVRRRARRRPQPSRAPRGVVPVRIKIISGGGGKPADGNRAVGHGGGGAVSAKNREAAPRPREARGGRNVGERAGPRRRHGAFHQHAGLRRVDVALP